MEQGYLYRKTEEEIKKDVKEGKEVKAGVSCESILDTINIYEINNAGKPEMVISLLKQEVMIMLGKVTTQEKQ